MPEGGSSGAPVADEPVLDVADIQGDILAGFRKDHEQFAFLRITDRAAARRGLGRLVPRLSPLADVAAFNSLFRAMRRRRGEIRGTLSVTWAGVAFSASGLAALTSPEEVESFEDEPFKLGMAKRSSLLGDPTDASLAGHPDRWLFGGKATPVDAVLLVASDDADQVEQTADSLLELLIGAGGFELVYAQPCHVRHDARGHEHFGFRDGISQPAPRGRLGSGPGSFLSPRLVDPSDQRALRFARPGQPLVWPGEFVLGLERQAIPPDDDLVPLPPDTPTPAWARNGSYLVIRRLRQDTDAFAQFTQRTAAELARRPGFAELTAERVAALLVGRWPSGAPLLRAPASDDPELGWDAFASNDFGYANAHPPMPLRAGVGHPVDTFPAAVADGDGAVCPMAAHVRKVNPRDQGTDIGGPRATLRRFILRRGLPFGGGPGETGDRGLMFACYQASIDRQFEFLIRDWVNQIKKPTGEPGGHDLLIAQAQSRESGRKRRAVLVGSDGSEATIEADTEWVIPTGGGYFFAPSISAVRDVLSE
jgi:Dyp-type peroxidase family